MANLIGDSVSSKNKMTNKGLRLLTKAIVGISNVTNLKLELPK